MADLVVVYIDDNIDTTLSKYLVEEYNGDIDVEYIEVPFNPSEGYESLLNNSDVKRANVILIDSQLFVNRTASEGNFTGEEFKLILKKFYPFIDVVVITQNDVDEEIKAIKKYDSLQTRVSSKEYYDRLLPEIFRNSLEVYKQYKFLAQKINSNASWDQLLKEKVLGTLYGCNTYDELKKEDIDKIVDAFKKIQEALDGK